jgi:hypothetical protein
VWGRNRWIALLPCVLVAIGTGTLFFAFARCGESIV